MALRILEIIRTAEMQLKHELSRKAFTRQEELLMQDSLESLSSLQGRLRQLL